METSGVITHGNYARLDVSLSGPTQIEGGNWLFARITTNNHALTINGGNTLGIRINGVKVDNFVNRTYGPLASAVEILAELGRGGPDAKEAWGVMVDIVHAETERLTWDAFKAAYISSFSGLTYSGSLLAMVETATGINTWDNVQDYIANHSRAQLMGEDTELIGEES